MLSPLRLLTPLNPTPLFSSSPSSSFELSSNSYGFSQKPGLRRKWALSKQTSSSSTSKFKSGNLNSSNLWLCGCMRRDEDASSSKNEGDNEVRMLGSDEDFATKVPTQAQTMVEGSGSLMVSEFKPSSDVDYLQELLAIQQQGPRAIGFFGTRNMGFMHQQLIEILSYAMVITKNHIYTSGASGTNAAVIRGALRAERPEQLTVILPQSLKMQSPESQELLSKVKNVIEKPHNDHLPLIEASRHSNSLCISSIDIEQLLIHFCIAKFASGANAYDCHRYRNGRDCGVTDYFSGGCQCGVILYDAERMQVENMWVKTCFEHLKNVAYDAEDRSGKDSELNSENSFRTSFMMLIPRTQLDSVFKWHIEPKISTRFRF